SRVRLNLHDLLPRAKKNFPLAGFKNKHFSAVADSPALDARRRSNVLCNRETLVADFIRSVGFNRETGSGRYAQRDRAVAGSCRYCVEVSIQRDFTIAGARVYLTVELNDANNTIASINLKLSA